MSSVASVASIVRARVSDRCPIFMAFPFRQSRCCSVARDHRHDDTTDVRDALNPLLPARPYLLDDAGDAARLVGQDPHNERARYARSVHIGHLLGPPIADQALQIRWQER